MERNKRIEWLDFAKGVMILFVILGHVTIEHSNTILSLLRDLLFIFVMPMFFSISGYLYKPVNTGLEYIVLLYKKVSSFIIPYIFFMIVSYLLNILKMINGYGSSINIHSILYMPIGYLWFLYVLFFIFIFVGSMDLFHVTLIYQIIISFILLFVQMYLPYQISGHGNINPLSGIGGYIICFYLGFIIKKFNINIKEHLLVVSIMIFIILIILEFYSTGISYNTDIMNYGDVISKLLCIPILFFIFIRIPHNKLFNYFVKYGKYTLIIYLVQTPLIIITYSILDKLSLNIYIIFVFDSVIVWYLSIFVCYLSNKFTVLNLIFYPRKYINKIIKKTKWGKIILMNM